MTLMIRNLESNGTQPPAALAGAGSHSAESWGELERLALVAQSTDDGVLITDRHGRTEWVNASFTRITGWTLDDIRGRVPTEVLHGAETSPVTTRMLVQTLAAGQPYRGELLNYRRDGSTLWCDVNITPVASQPGVITHRVAIYRDVTVRRLAAQRMIELTAAVEAATDGVAVIDDRHRFRFANDAFAALFGYARGSELWGKSWRPLFDAEHVRTFDAQVFKTLMTNQRWSGEVECRRREGSAVTLELSLTLLPGGSVVLVARDITERKASEEALRRLSLSDHLTSLYNRRGFETLAQQQLAVASRSGRSCVLFFIDIDDFKRINDTFGHRTGDEALEHFAAILRASFRASDVLSRLGGDEFAVLAVDCEGTAEARVLERLDRRLAAYNLVPGRSWRLNVTCGVARVSPSEQKSLAALIAEADARLYQRKRARLTQAPEAESGTPAVAVAGTR
jgi:diguanylate cyclase (GGDEF)-like protein/PAS domain S-box-containing protein